MVKNNLVEQGMSFPAFIKSDKVLNSLSKTLGSETKKSEFVSSVISAVQTNPALQDCEFNSIINCALLGTSLKLMHSPQLGQYYMVPYSGKAQFQLGYKGYIQLAVRTGAYEKLNVLAIKEGELIRYDPLEEEIEVHLIEDEEIRENTPTIGYYAMFKYNKEHGGLKKAIYWSKSKMEAHAKKYSKSYSSFWGKDFDGMAYKTMLRQLISKWGTMSVDFQKAYEGDMSVLNNDGTYDYVDNPNFDVTSDSKPTKEVVEEQPVKQEAVQEEQPTLL